MAQLKTQPTDASVDAYIASRASPAQEADCRALMALLEKVTHEKPRMWGPSIVGYGTYRYTYDSGRTGEMCRAGFAIRGRELVVYLISEGAEQEALRARLGTHRMGKSCLYLRRLADIDASVLEQLVAGSVAQLKARYG